MVKLEAGRGFDPGRPSAADVRIVRDLPDYPVQIVGTHPVDKVTSRVYLIELPPFTGAIQKFLHPFRMLPPCVLSFMVSPFKRRNGTYDEGTEEIQNLFHG